jgi:hypothetical protein
MGNPFARRARTVVTDTYTGRVQLVPIGGGSLVNIAQEPILTIPGHCLLQNRPPASNPASTQIYDGDGAPVEMKIELEKDEAAD